MARAEQKLAEEGSSSSSLVASQSAFAVMMGAQIARQRVGSERAQAQEELESLRSRLAAAEERMEEIQMEERRLGLGPKKLRAADAEWKTREYSGWVRVEQWRQEEGRIYNARRQKPNARVDRGVGCVDSVRKSLFSPKKCSNFLAGLTPSKG